MEIFSFRDFTLQQSAEVFKLGTDTLILGAIGSAFSGKRVLEIGAGTGAVSLMYAAKNPSSLVTAIEIQQAAFEICQDNFQESPFASRIEVIHGAVQNFTSETNFDLILSNPPYFKDALPSAAEAKLKARHQVSLDFPDLLRKSAELLSPSGIACFIIPAQAYSQMKRTGLEKGLFVREVWEVFYKENDDKPTSVVVSMCKKESGVPKRNVLRVKNSGGGYHAEYAALLQNFLPDQHFQ
jgi:tRNA1Val (adenine37-N6)-methyltransferase